MTGRYATLNKGVPLKELAQIVAECERQRHSKHGNHVVLDGPEWDAIYDTLAARGLIIPGSKVAR